MVKEGILIKVAKGRTGFTLVEIMIVIAIISVVASLTFPVLLRVRHNANETSAVSSVRTVAGALDTYRGAQAPVTYPATLAPLNTQNPQYIDPVLASGSKQGYSFIYSRTNANAYTLSVIPQQSGVTGTRSFFVDETGVIRVAASGIAGSGSPPLE